MRTLILSLDWDSTLFWRDAISQNRIDESSLPISPELKRRLNNYYRQYSELHFTDDASPIEISTLDKRLLDDVGLEIWQRLRTELNGIHHVHFYSQQFSETFDNPDAFIRARSL